MPRNGSGSYTRVANSFSNPVTGTAIDPAHADALFDDLEAEITDSLCRKVDKGGMLTHLIPDTDDGYALGTTAKKWADLFLAAGAVIDFNNGDLTLTHSTDDLKLGGGTLTLPNTGLHVLDTDASHDLIIASGENLSADCTFSIVTGNANRTLTLTGNSSIGGTAYVAGGTDVPIVDGGTGASTAAGARSNLSAATNAQVWEYHGFIALPGNKSYTVALKLGHGFTITETTTKSASGTCTATFKINATALGGTANSVSSTEQSQAHASANVAVAGDDLVLTISANSACADLSFTISGTRSLA